MKRFINNNIGKGNQEEMNSGRKIKLNRIYTYLSMGLDYNAIIENIPELTEDELNYTLWYLASKGLRYVPTLS